MGLFVDCHCHLDHPDLYAILPELIERARKAGVTTIISNGVNPRTNRITLELSELYPEIKAALGLYPIDALQKEGENNYSENLEKFDVDEELTFIRKQKNRMIALGEVGLDYKMSSEEKERSTQREVFQKIIDLSEKIKKPIIVHTRKAELDCIEMLESSSNKMIVLHCFSGKFKLVKRAADNGWMFTIPTNVVRSQQFQKIAKEINISQLLTETDAPYLSPYKDKMNEPSFVVESVKKIAELKKLDLIEVKNNLYMNYQKIFL